MTEPRYNRSAMLSRPGPLLSWFGRRYFDRVNLEPKAIDRLRALPAQGQLIYVMRTRSVLDYLFFNHLLLKIGLPLASFANGIDLSLFRGLGLWLANLWARISGGTRDPTNLLERAILQEQSALIFMKKRAWTAERQANPGFIELLVKLQRTLDRPLLLLPQHINWPPSPPSRTRGLFDILFGEQEAAGRLRKLGHFLRHHREARVQVGEPINLKTVLEAHPGWSDERLGRKVRRVLLIHLVHEALAIRGPAVKPSPLLRREILERRTFKAEVEREGRAQGLGPTAAMEQAARYLKEIAASWNAIILQLFCRFLDFLFTRVFQGVEVDQEGVRRVKEAARESRRAPLVLIPCHKSHVDYLVISWVFQRNEFVPPHIAAGANLSFFPLGAWLRRSGAFFLRRTFSGLPLYKLTFKHYLWKLVREGYPIEFFIEGGRTRTGKLLPPKLGMLSMLMEGLDRGEFKDLTFVPINISYERVVETGSYRHELTGGAKKSESVGGVVKASQVLRYRYGRIYVSLEQPIRLSDYLRAKGQGHLLPKATESAVSAAEPGDLRALTQPLAYHLMRQVQEATVVTPSALLGMVLLSHDRRGLSGASLRERVGFLVDFLARRNARLSRSIEHLLTRHQGYLTTSLAKGELEGHRARGEILRPLLDEALALLKRLLQSAERGGTTIYTVPDKARIELDYYRNTLLGLVAPDALVATVTLAQGPLPRADLLDQIQTLASLLRLEFVYDLAAGFGAQVDRLVAEGLLEEREGGISAAQPKALAFLQGGLLHLLEGYWVAIEAAKLLRVPTDKAAWLTQARELAERLFLEGELTRPEAASTAILGNALERLVSLSLIQVGEKPAGKKSQPPLTLTGPEATERLETLKEQLQRWAKH